MRLCFAAILTLSGVAARAQEALDYPALLQRLVDVDWLWQPPREGERCVQFSSYDRGSDAGPGSPGWYANDDRGKYLRVEERDGQKEFVMVDAQGPGCVARIWSANPSGTLHFDVDGARVWSVDFGKLCSGQVDGVPEPIAGVRSKGGNCYLPIPFAKSLVVSATAGDLYYAVDVVQWPAGTQLPTFTPELLVAHSGAVREIARSLVPPDWPPPFRHSEADWMDSEWSGVMEGRVLQSFDLQLATRDVQVRHRAVLVVRCGEEETIRVPLLDFFSAGPDARPWNGRMLRADDFQFRCSWPMPMPNGGSVRVLDGSTGEDLAFFWRANIRELAAPKSAPLLFRASYHLVKGVPTRPFTDHLVLDAKGRGRFVGCSLLVRNPSRIWWGEGDEKFTVDGEKFPSWFGTGTEDYFGYAWCDPTPFSAPFHAQIECQGPANFGFTQLHRTHVLDSVPFQSSFRFELERWHWVETANIDYATVAYWYGAPGALSGLPDVPPAEERLLERLDGPPVFVAEDALEGEDLRVVACSGGTHEVLDLGLHERTFSRDRNRWWRDGKPGDVLTLAVPVPARGTYRVSAGFVQADDFGIVQMALGGERLGEPFDGYAARVGTSGERELGVVVLPGGEVELRLQIVGSNPQAKPRHMVGLDYLRLEKIE